MGRDKEADLRKLADAFMQGLEFRQDYEYGAPGLDQKRPFGSSAVELDVLNIIGWETVDESMDPRTYGDQMRYAQQLFTRELVPYIQRMWRELTAPKTEPL